MGSPPHKVKMRRKYQTLTELWKGTTLEMALNSSLWDSVPRGYRRVSYNNVLQSDTCILNGDLNEVGITKMRWTKYTHQYTLPGLGDIIAKCKEIPEAAEQLIPLKFNPRIVGGHSRGQCLLGISYHRGCLSFFSRAVSFPDRAVLDLNLANRLSRMISSPEETGFTWHIALLYISPVWAMVFFRTQGLLDRVLSGPLGKEFSLFMEKAKESRDYKFKPFVRMRRRMRRLETESLPSYPIESLKLPEEVQ